MIVIATLLMIYCNSPQERASGEENPSILLRPALHLIQRHREEYTLYDGPRCPMYPSCAAYAEKAIRQHSFLGLILFANRLFFVEQGDLSAEFLIAPRRLSEHPRYYNPVSDDIPFGARPSLLKEEFRD